MYYVYRIQSLKDPKQYYTGFTHDLEKRIQEHNNGKTTHTSKYKPWKVVNSLTFIDKSKAIAFEKYLKSGCGREFVKKYF